MGTRLLATLTAFSLLFTGTAVADVTQTSVDRKIVQEGLDEITRLRAQGAQVRVADGRDRFTARSGTAELNSSRPVPIIGRFRAGSVTKSFTSTVVLQLAGEGKVELDAPVDRYLPGLIDKRITVRQLLQMTGGLYNYTNSLSFDPEGFEEIRYKHWEPEDLVAIATVKPLQFEPGTKWEYNNTNYVILGLLIEKVTGKQYEKVVGQRVLKPLHLNDTTFPGDDTNIHGPHAHSYGLVKGRPADTTYWNPSVFWAAGDVISTTRDLDAYFSALLTGRLLRPAQQAELTRTTPVSTEYGLGLFVEKAPCGTTIVGHPGGVPGSLTYAYQTPDLKRRVQFSATDGLGTGDPTPAYEKLINEIFC
ncbi:beta-lactamase family protein [Lentzea sp. PSKA42]|uniref:Beta-lactamase family protein n=1 Tax=Lentzea indica TaxID=2604800 RepID=A0ABX1FCQ2_9PSEU|nr:serine hydrolase domain-containing protein [Lentzea indica]NKE56736.1 beta-lactamase family protein [Lentzea indica]